MTWSLRIGEDGDFHVAGARLETSVAQQKLLQDFRCALLEKMGTDNLHPDFGSLIDGGVSPDGVVSEGVIGETDIQMVSLTIQSEIARIARKMQNAQLARAKSDRLTYGRATMVPQEVLLQLNEINLVQKEDSLFVTINITAANNDNFDISLPISTSPSNS